METYYALTSISRLLREHPDHGNYLGVVVWHLLVGVADCLRYPREQIVRISIQSQRDAILFGSNPCLLLHKLLAARFQSFQSID